MSTVSGVIATGRVELGEVLTGAQSATSGKFWINSEIAEWINKAHKIIASRIPNLIVQDKSFALVANQDKYPIFSDLIQTEKVTYRDLYTIYPDSLRKIEDRGGSDVLIDIPTECVIWGTQASNGYFIISPRPSTSAKTTTINQSGFTASTTTLTVASTSNFESRGRIIIESEEIEYSAKNSTQLLQLVRGRGGTTAASHANGTTVTQADIHIFYNRQPSELIFSSSVEIPIRYDALLYLYAAAFGLRKQGDSPGFISFINLFKDGLRDAVSVEASRQSERVIRRSP